eukprot:PhM_4_TR15412/c0_g1_i1/m.18547/K01489/cdd, CDA; cytidine deaminase
MSTNVVQLKPISELPANYADLLKQAHDVARNSYCPYSNFRVGAALLHPDGEVTLGTNWENCTYQGTCAERTAIVSANVKGRRKATAIAVHAYSIGDHVPPSPPDFFVTPCGLCRQMLNEVAQLSGGNLDIVMANTDLSQAAVVPIGALLPNSFGPADIGVDIVRWSTENVHKK